MSRVGGRRVGNQKTREQIRLGSESLAKLRRMPRKVAQKYSILYTISRGETIGQQDKFSRKLIEQSGRGNKQYLKNITGWAHRGCRTGNYSPIRWEELGSYNEKPQLPQGPGSRPLPAPPSILVLEELCSFSLYQGLRESLASAKSSTVNVRFVGLLTRIWLVGYIQG